MIRVTDTLLTDNSHVYGVRIETNDGSFDLDCLDRSAAERLAQQIETATNLQYDAWGVVFLAH